MTGTKTDTIETVTLEGVKTVHTIIRDGQGQLVSDTTVVTQVTPHIEPEEKQHVEPEPRVKKEAPEATSSPRVWGPRTKPLASGGGRYPDGFQALPRLVGPDPVGEAGQCEHWTDYYLVDERTHEEHYTGSRYNGVGACY